MNLDEAAVRKNEFLATLAHELRNPLTPIRNALAIRELSGDGPGAREADAMMVRQVRNLTRLVDDLLDVSRISLGRIDLVPQELDLRAAVAAVVELERSVAREAGQRISVRAPEEPVWLHADPVRLHQVVGNLLTNAIKYTEPGGRIDVSITIHDASAVLEVADDGLGISAEMLPRVWDLFAQGDQPHYRSRGGIGVGLSLVRKLVELHGGTVEAASEGKGRGSRFTVRIPISAPRDHARDQDPEVLGAPIHAHRRVLVVDDDHDVATSLGVLLGLMGHEVRVATDGPAALVTADEFRPQVIFVDIGLGSTSGLDVARRLRENPRIVGVTLVALTGYGTEEDRARSVAAGFDLHLVKPADPDMLDAILARPIRDARSVAS